MNDLTHPGTPVQPVFLGIESEAEPHSPVPADWREQLRSQLSRIHHALTETPGLELLFLQAFIAPGLTRDELAEELIPALNEHRPVVTVTPVRSLPAGAHVGLETVLVPRGDRSSSGSSITPSALRIGSYFAMQAHGTVGSSTTEKIHSGLSDIRAAFDAVQVTAGDVIKYNIFYRGEGTREEWADPVRLRASLFSGPGPCTTGIPVRDFDDSETDVQMLLFGKATARCENDAAAVRPANHWDWPIPLPYFHGNRVSDLMLAGGQVSLAANSEVIDPHDLRAQVHRSVRYIESVFRELGGSLCEVTRLTAFFENARDEDSMQIRGAIAEAMPAGAQYELSLIGLDKLSYPDMRVEIEAQGIRRKP